MHGAFIILLKFCKLTHVFLSGSKTDFILLIAGQFLIWYSSILRLVEQCKQYWFNAITYYNNAKMKIFDDITGENIKVKKTNKSQIPDHSYKILITGASGSAKPNH